MSIKESILITGDFCPVNRVGELLRNRDIDNVFQDFLPYIKGSVLAITNLECPLTNSHQSISKTGPALKASSGTAEFISEAGFNLVTLANNHIMDFGADGLNSTISACTSNLLSYVGVGQDLSRAQTAFRTEIGDKTISILNIAENEFSTTHGNYPGANPMNPVSNYYDIRKARSESDLVLVIVHGGHESYNLPSPRIKETLRFFADAGASAIFQHHAHCYSGYEVYNGVPIFYGLGNFLFDKDHKRNSPWNYGYAVELIVEELLNFKIIPYEQNNDKAGLKLLQGSEKEDFFSQLDKLNLIIQDDELLAREFMNYCNRSKRLYSSFLEPHSNRILHYLRNRKIIPSLLSKYKRSLYLNLIRCESHRDVVMKILKSGSLKE